MRMACTICILASFVVAIVSLDLKPRANAQTPATQPAAVLLNNAAASIQGDYVRVAGVGVNAGGETSRYDVLISLRPTPDGKVDVARVIVNEAKGDTAAFKPGKYANGGWKFTLTGAGTQWNVGLTQGDRNYKFDASWSTLPMGSNPYAAALPDGVMLPSGAMLGSASWREFNAHEQTNHILVQPAGEGFSVSILERQEGKGAKKEFPFTIRKTVVFTPDVE